MESPVRAFKEEIASVCRKHGLVITVSDYDNLQVWPMDDQSLEQIMEAEDMTAVG